MRNLKLRIAGPKEFFLELNDLFRALAVQKDTLSPQTKDALARVLSWIPYMRHTGVKTVKESA